MSWKLSRTFNFNSIIKYANLNVSSYAIISMQYSVCNYFMKCFVWIFNVYKLSIEFFIDSIIFFTFLTAS